MNSVNSAPRFRSLVWVVPDFVPGLGGTSTQTRVVAGAFVRRGYSVRVLARRHSRKLARRATIEGLPVRRVGLPGVGFVADRLGPLSVAVALARVRRRTDAVFVLTSPDFVVSAAVAGLRKHTVMGWAGLGDATDALGPTAGRIRGLIRALRRRVLTGRPNLVLIPTMATELTRLGLDNEIVPLPVDTERFRPPVAEERSEARAGLGLTDGELAIVYTGQLRRLKAVDRLIEAYAEFAAREPRSRLLLVGGASGTEDACEGELRDQIAAGALGDRVTITGTVADVRPYLWAADVFVLPSSREGMSYSLLEAMACGIACVAPERPIGRDVLGDAGVVPPDNEPATLLASLLRLAGDSDERSRLGKAALEAAQSLAVEPVVDRYEAVLAGVARRRR